MGKCTQLWYLNSHQSVCLCMNAQTIHTMSILYLLHLDIASFRASLGKYFTEVNDFISSLTKFGGPWCKGPKKCEGGRSAKHQAKRSLLTMVRGDMTLVPWLDWGRKNKVGLGPKVHLYRRGKLFTHILHYFLYFSSKLTGLFTGNKSNISVRSISPCTAIIIKNVQIKEVAEKVSVFFIYFILHNVNMDILACANVHAMPPFWHVGGL